VSYEITGSFEVMGNCHCTICRKIHGAPFVTWGIIDPTKFSWKSGEELVQMYESSPGRERGFCRVCGSSLVSGHAGMVGEVAVGSVEGDPGARASEHIFVRSKAPWYEITDTLPQHEEWPPGMAP